MGSISDSSTVEHFTYCAICGPKVTARDGEVVRIEPDQENPE